MLILLVGIEVGAGEGNRTLVSETDVLTPAKPNNHTTVGFNWSGSSSTRLSEANCCELGVFLSASHALVVVSGTLIAFANLLSEMPILTRATRIWSASVFTSLGNGFFGQRFVEMWLCDA